ncbi:hypothetical protein INT43_008947 [Umbelopsis isabellina]|uniref:N-acetyltransferase domain-containing protein n=1 Tax=Mortierella isabellina TaxID=91625 RepID=A0A8H7PVI3_MORIS|nr:hypothetical protein INT43_008947 [Umbelopsis isabellina]
MARHTADTGYTSAQKFHNSDIREERGDRITLRAGTIGDALAIAEIGGSVFSATFGHSLTETDLNHYLQKSYSVEAITADMNNPLMDFVVAYNEHDRVVGFAQMTQGTSEPCVADAELPVELQRIYLHQDFHGLGIGKRLIQEIENIARSKGFITMWLGVWEENFKAQKVYQKAGYTKVGDHDFKMGYCIQTDWIMSKIL